MSKGIPIEDLAIIRFKTQSAKDNRFEETTDQWKTDHCWMPVEACARQLWVGRKQDIADLKASIPNFDALTHSTNPRGEPVIRIEEGGNAYRYLLDYLIGDKSALEGETHVIRQFRDAIQRFETNVPHVCCQIKPIFDMLMEDQKTIRTHITKDMQPSRPSNAILALCNKKAGAGEAPRSDRILLVGDTDSTSAVYPDILQLLVQLSRKNNIGPRNIYLTHPNDKELPGLLKQCQTFCDEKKLSVRLHATPFSQAISPDDLPSTEHSPLHGDAIIVYYPMGKNPEVDTALSEAWNSKCLNMESRLIHAVGHRGKTIEPWLHSNMARDDLYFSPDDIKTQQKLMSERNKELSGTAKDAITNCIYSRFELGAKPKGEMLSLPPTEYTQEASKWAARVGKAK